MILLDVNVVVALYASDHAFHLVARRWFAQLRDTEQVFGVTLGVWHSFLRIITNPVMANPPVSIDAAVTFVRSTSADQLYRPIEAGMRHLDLLRDVCIDGQVQGTLIPDAVLAAIAIENGAAVASFDRDFARFSNLRWVIPGE